MNAQHRNPGMFENIWQGIKNVLEEWGGSIVVWWLFLVMLLLVTR